MASPAINELTRREWRELGFHYSLDAPSRTWLIEASPEGLLLFAACLRAFALNPASQELSEHEHFGPYMHLEVMSASVPEVNEHCIQGTPADLLRLAIIVKERASHLVPGASVNITCEYAPASSHRLLLRAHPSGTDPASLDPELVGAS